MAVRPNFTISGRLETKFMRRDTAQVEADTLALRSPAVVYDPR